MRAEHRTLNRIANPSRSWTAAFLFLLISLSTAAQVTPSWVAEPGQAGAQFGTSAASAGDVNGDGYDDVIVGAPYYTNGEDREGRAYLYYGGPNGLSGLPGWSVESNQLQAEFGHAVAGAGDVNNDGYDDIIVGAWFYDKGQTNEGGAFLYYGSPSGPSQTPAWTGESNQVWALYGVAVAGAGDVNNDGFDDVIVGAYYYDDGQQDEGAAFLYFGSASGLSPSFNWKGASDLASAEYGISVAGAGDVNNDGFDDIIVGADWFANGQLKEGRVFAYYGSSTGPALTANWTAESNQGDGQMGISVASAGDIDSDGFDDVVVGAYRYDNGQTNEGRAYLYRGTSTGLETTPSWVAEGNQEWAYFGYRVAGIGDMNDDGYDDVAVSAWWYDDGFDNEGGLFVYGGSEDGLSSASFFYLASGQADSGFGSAVAPAGDVHNDGHADLVVGALTYTNGEVNEGRVYMIPGVSGAIPVGPPAPVITTNGGADFTVKTSNVTIAGTNGVDTAEIQINGSTSGVTRPTSTTWSYTGPLAEGPNLLVATAMSATDVPSIPDIITVTYDATAPGAPVITTDGGNGAGVDFATNQAEVSLQGTTEAGTTQILVNGAVAGVTFTSGQTTWSYTGLLTVGENDIAVTALDGAENESVPGEITVTLDTTPPSPPEITTNGGEGAGEDFVSPFASLTLEGTTDHGTRAIHVNGGTANVTFTEFATEWSYNASLTVGSNAFSVTAFDAAGNESLPAEIAIDYNPALLPPPVITTNGGNGNGVDFTTTKKNWTIWGTTSAATASIEVTGVTGSAVYEDNDTYWYIVTTLAEGPNVIEARAVNGGGLKSYPDTLTITVDTNGPDAPVILTNNGEDYATQQAALVLQGTVGNDAVTVRVNNATTGVSYTPGAGVWSFATTMTEGPHTYSVTAVDASNLISPAAAITVSLDTTAPSPPTITTDGGNGQGVDFATNQSTIDLNGTSPADAQRILVNGQESGVTYTPGSSIWSYTGPLNGDRDFDVVAEDAAGNQSNPASIHVTLDTTPPPAPVIATNNGVDFATTSAAVMLEGTCSDETAAIRVNGSTAGVTHTPGATTWSFTGTLATGENTFTATARDGAGNDSTGDSITVTLTTAGAISAWVTIDTADGEIDLGDPINLEGDFGLDPPVALGLLAGATIQLRYRLEGVVEVVRSTQVNAQHKWFDTYKPTRTGAWKIQARYQGTGALQSTDWTDTVTIMVIGDTNASPNTDLNGDGETNAVDIQLMINALLGIVNLGPAADVNQDGSANAADLQLVVNAALGL